MTSSADSFVKRTDAGGDFGKNWGCRVAGREVWAKSVECSFGKVLVGGGCCTVAMFIRLCVCVCARAETMRLQERSGLDSDFPLRSLF